MKKKWAQRDLNGSRPIEPASVFAKIAGKLGVRTVPSRPQPSRADIATGNMVATIALLFLAACGARTEPGEEFFATPDCSAATCIVIDTKAEVGCRVSSPVCDGLYDQLCPPSPSFAPVCRNHLR